MKIKYHKTFLKNYKKRIKPYPKLVAQFTKQLNKFIKDQTDATVRDHRLIGKMKSFRAFSVTGDVRVIYVIINDELWLYDVGSHNQVY